MINREELTEEMKLRQQIRKAIKIVKEKRNTAEQEVLKEENHLRSVIRKLIEAEVATEIPGRSTGINVLEDLLKRIVPIIEDDFKQLTTDKAQRKSYRTHIVNGIQSLLAPSNVVDAGAEEISEIDIEVGGEEDDAFIDVREPDAEEELPEVDPDLDDFGVEGEDETGRNMAYETLKTIFSTLTIFYQMKKMRKSSTNIL